MKKIFSIILLAVTVVNSSAQNKKYHSDKLIPVATFGDRRAIGVKVSADNRLFVSFPNRGASYKYGLVEIRNGREVPFPDDTWNTSIGDNSSYFVSVQDLYIDTDDKLWVLDSKPSSGGSIFGNNGGMPAQGYFKLVKIDLKTNSVDKVYTFDDLDKARSGLNDIRIDTEKGLGYLSDPGQAAIVVLDLISGKTRTVLKKQPSTLADTSVVLKYDGVEMRDKDGKPFRSNVNGIALTKDNKYFYFKPINQEYLYRIETRYLADAKLSDEELSTKVQDMSAVGITHGLEADRKGNIYLTTSTDYTIKYLSPDGKLNTLVQDSRIIWPDSMGIGTDGYLYFSCAQLNREPQWNNGQNKAELPYTVYKVKLP
ncbi:major royal jelly family protein [Mucilaginibacter sp. UR6-1]|uniref:SMP-30/gluconolactonase/LRE family protein n=1 Tax=Mucilaginibacter sp. UR6-1 TaxID=1435643 RepID=UPI001E492CE6|nr:major royal jelly family protein [Mucilaginibacter sp. UR6-1]MCC8407907.1 major royal jelly family protein [Mucilaginibacter sp. UR6-1]